VKKVMKNIYIGKELSSKTKCLINEEKGKEEKLNICY